MGPTPSSDGQLWGKGRLAQQEERHHAARAAAIAYLCVDELVGGQQIACSLQGQLPLLCCNRRPQQGVPQSQQQDVMGPESLGELRKGCLCSNMCTYEHKHTCMLSSTATMDRAAGCNMQALFRRVTCRRLTAVAASPCSNICSASSSAR